MNIFNKIGNQIEKKKKERKDMNNKYWKLSASERIDYDNKIEKIKKGSEINFFSLPITRLICKGSLFFIILILLLAFSSNFPLNKLLEILKPLSLLMVKGILYSMIFDMLLTLTAILVDDSDKKLKQLNKRFKLK